MARKSDVFSGQSRVSSEKAAEHVDYSLFSPTDFRYSVMELVPFLSEEAYVKYKAKIESALAEELAYSGLCSKEIASEIRNAADHTSAKEVYAEEKRIKHDVRALANVIRSKVSDKAKPFVHLGATSYDIVDTANALRFKNAILEIVVPDLATLETHLIQICRLHADTVQIGRTHGQHAEPITFGYFLSNYISRLGNRIMKLDQSARLLVGKFSGAVGVYGPLSLMVPDPEEFEARLMQRLGLSPSEVSTQIVQPEPLVDLIHEIIMTFGVIANFCRDMRHLQRTEISEISEEFGSSQVGSSTMPQKRNPISFENIESLWKKFMPQIITVYLDQISEHQRDLTNSASQRYLPELIVIFDYCVRRLDRTIWNENRNSPKLVVNKANMSANFAKSKDEVSAEPLYILLALSAHPDAHEAVRRVVQNSIQEDTDFLENLKKDKSIRAYINSIDPKKWSAVEEPERYTGVAVRKSIRIADEWERKMSELSFVGK